MVDTETQGLEMDRVEIARLLQSYVGGLRSSIQSLSFMPGARPENLMVARYLEQVIVRAGAVTPDAVIRKVSGK